MIFLFYGAKVRRGTVQPPVQNLFRLVQIFYEPKSPAGFLPNHLFEKI
jgi:hypothetical protein